MTNNKQRGGTLLGIIVGVLVGLGVALGVAVYVMKVPTPFNNKSASRTPAQDAAESKKNKDWDPNAALSNKPAAKPVDPALAPVPPSANPQATPDKAAKPSTAAAPTASNSPTTPAPAAAPATGDGAVEFFVQVGAFRSDADAQALRAKLALSNFDGKVIERDQMGQKVYRVRVGPLPTLAASDKTKAGLEAAGFDAVVMRTQR